MKEELPSLIVLTVSRGCNRAQELRQSVKDQLPSLIVPTVSVDVRYLRGFRERRSPVPNSSYGLCGRKIA